ncbi:hypothetical protein POJ06DRAFT_248999 [Lipomyces tetrasporus]|uniref:Cora-domain-containing protein n=1 Tax=Lipomyces tetrasporus TaxID=54092 RepID=A0AAD7VTJ7_9ASCO|nr:uncharacterized protein POJ06DRAFT_248999 [Lipomyces tetrasporus]KAJ8102172.1 hypothetical protein POJ06DRAFT_248999 [Lipomyces tetrasporus]
MSSSSLTSLSAQPTTVPDQSQQRQTGPVIFDSAAHPVGPPIASNTQYRLQPQSAALPSARLVPNRSLYSLQTLGGDSRLNTSDTPWSRNSSAVNLPNQAYEHAGPDTVGNGGGPAGKTNNATTAASKSGLRARQINQLLKREWKDWGKKRNYKSPTTDRGEVGWEPGIDVRHTEVELGENSIVTIIDYSSDRYRVVNKVDKYSIDEFLKDTQPWASVRWINVNSLSWEVVRSIAAFYNLHPLAIEDMVDIPKRAKADNYKNQTFCTLPLHKIVNTAAIDAYFEGLHKYSFISRVLGKKNKTESLKSLNLNLAKVMAEQNMMTMQEWNNPTLGNKYLDSKRTLGKYHEVVAIEQVSIFLVDDHTVISFFENSADDIEGPILSRIASPSTLLREYPEASLLLQAILDSIVDIVLKIIFEYQKYIAELQIDVLASPSMAHTRDLHILSEELSMLRGTLMPIHGLVQSLRDYASISKDVYNDRFTGGYISEFAKLYLADVSDHVLSFTDNLDLMRHTTENMINLIFNTMSVQENSAMHQLTLVTIVFLPLTFLTGFFGMNFQHFGALEHSTMYFWSIAIPVTVVVVGLISWSLIKSQVARLGRYYEKRAIRQKHSHQQFILRRLVDEEKRNQSTSAGFSANTPPTYKMSESSNGSQPPTTSQDSTAYSRHGSPGGPQPNGNKLSDIPLEMLPPRSDGTPQRVTPNRFRARSPSPTIEFTPASPSTGLPPVASAPVAVHSDVPGSYAFQSGNRSPSPYGRRQPMQQAQSPSKYAVLHEAGKYLNARPNASNDIEKAAYEDDRDSS